jgi:uncharacterized protein with HEPN domain
MPFMPFDPDAVRRWRDDIHQHIILAEQFSDGMDYDALRADLCKTYAVTRCLEIISEASRRFAGRAEGQACFDSLA